MLRSSLVHRPVIRCGMSYPFSPLYTKTRCFFVSLFPDPEKMRTRGRNPRPQSWSITPRDDASRGPEKDVNKLVVDIDRNLRGTCDGILSLIECMFWVHWRRHQSMKESCFQRVLTLYPSLPVIRSRLNLVRGISRQGSFKPLFALFTIAFVFPFEE